jgi:hypothetical protein
MKCDLVALALWDDPRDVQRDGRIKQRSGKVGQVLPRSPSALGCVRLVLRLVFSSSASLEKTWIG